MNVRTVGNAAGASIATVLGKIGDAVTVAALDSALAGGLTRHRGGTSSKSIVNPDAGSVTHRSMRTTAPAFSADHSWIQSDHTCRGCVRFLSKSDRLKVILPDSGSHCAADRTNTVRQKP